MKRTHIKSLVIAALPLFVFLTLLTLRTPKAYAALAGEDGVIVAVEAGQNDGDPQTSVVTMQPDGSGVNVVAESTDSTLITAVTVSKPEGTSVTDQTNTVVYSESVAMCYTPYDEEVARSMPEYVACDDSNGEGDFSHVDVNVNSIIIDANGVPVSTSSLVTTIGTATEEYFAYQEITNLSFSPDSSQVVDVRVTLQDGFYDKAPIAESGSEQLNISDSYQVPLWRLERITVADGSIEELVSPRFDPYLNGGYGENGNIYYSRLNEAYTNENAGLFDSEYSTDIWYIPTGGSAADARRITDTAGINEYYVDASPDNTKLIVRDFITGDYYYVDLTSGCLTPMAYCALLPVGATDMEITTFSPKGTRFAGQQNGWDYAVRISDEIENPYGIAVANATDPSTSTIIRARRAYSSKFTQSSQVEWAPKLAAAPQVLGSSTTVASTVSNKLVNTGVNASLISLISVALLGTSLVTLLRKPQN